MMFIHYGQRASTAGCLLQIAIARFQEQIGVSFSTLENVYSPLLHLESKGIKSLCDFLASIDVKLKLDKQTYCTATSTPIRRSYYGYHTKLKPIH
jgi:hypothetical protein